MDLIHSEKLIAMGYALGLSLVGYVLARRIRSLLDRALSHRFSRHHALLISRAGSHLIFLMFFISSLQHLGFNLSVLLGAAGVFTVAISFASQTAVSNLISGIFLLFERPFKVGDTIEVKGINGVVYSIDLLSTRLTTSDNRLVRIPNEVLIKSEITNLSYFDKRRIDLILSVAYSADIPQVKDVLLTIANQCKGALADPAPNVIINNFADISVDLKLMVWVRAHDLTLIKNMLQEEIKQQFDKQGIEMPSPQITIQRAHN